MKTARDPRHQKRREIVKELFALSFARQPISPMVERIYSKKKTIDEKIEKAAPQWPADKLNKIDLAILRLAVFELMEDKAPQKVIIDEAIELAKEFGGESAPAFINGVLGKILKEI